MHSQINMSEIRYRKKLQKIFTYSIQKQSKSKTIPYGYRMTSDKKTFSHVTVLLRNELNIEPQSISVSIFTTKFQLHFSIHNASHTLSEPCKPVKWSWNQKNWNTYKDVKWIRKLFGKRKVRSSRTWKKQWKSKWDFLVSRI